MVLAVALESIEIVLLSQESRIKTNFLIFENAIKSMEINTDAKVCFIGTLLEHGIQLFVIYSSKRRG